MQKSGAKGRRASTEGGASAPSSETKYTDYVDTPENRAYIEKVKKLMVETPSEIPGEPPYLKMTAAACAIMDTRVPAYFSWTVRKRPSVAAVCNALRGRRGPKLGIAHGKKPIIGLVKGQTEKESRSAGLNCA